MGIIVSALGAAQSKRVLATYNWLNTDPVEESATYDTTIGDLVETIKMINMAPYHDKCNPLPDLIKDIDTLISASLKDSLTEETIEYMAKRRAKFGSFTVPAE